MGPVLRDFGEAGLAFQLPMIAGLPRQLTRLGKTVGGRLGSSMDAAHYSSHKSGRSRRSLEQPGFFPCAGRLDESGILDEVWQLARECLDRAGTVLAQLPDSEALRHLRALLDELAVRQA